MAVAWRHAALPQSLSRVLCHQRTLLVARAGTLRAAAARNQAEAAAAPPPLRPRLSSSPPPSPPTGAQCANDDDDDDQQHNAVCPTDPTPISAALFREALVLASAGAAAAAAALLASPPPAALAAAAAAADLASAAAAAAASADPAAVGYDPSGGEGAVKAVSGALYVGLVSFFLWRVLGRRARRARQERLAGQSPVETPFTGLLRRLREKRDAMRADETEQGKSGEAGPADAFVGALQAGAIAAGLWYFTGKVEASVAASALPEGLTARNMAVTVRTILLGMLYLVTFIFSANCLGLGALAVQMVVAPGSVPDNEQEAAEAAARRRAREAAGAGVPRVSVRSSPEELRAAFSRAGARQREAEEAQRLQARDRARLTADIDKARAEAQVAAGEWKVTTLSGEDDE